MPRLDFSQTPKELERNTGRIDDLLRGPDLSTLRACSAEASWRRRVSAETSPNGDTLRIRIA